MGTRTVGSREFGGLGEPRGKATGQPGFNQFGVDLIGNLPTTRWYWGKDADECLPLPPVSKIRVARLFFVIHTLELI